MGRLGSPNVDESVSLGGASEAPRPLTDPFQRPLRYLRLSLTEACNLACTYCMPNNAPEYKRMRAFLPWQQLDTILQGFRQLGFTKLRLTGGEPTVHPNALDAVARARELGFEQIATTTNAISMKDPRPWQDAGLGRINISLDTLDAAKFRDMTGRDGLNRVVELIDEAVAAGLEVKINTVLMRSRNGSDAEIDGMIDWALERPVTLRFIELMDTSLNQEFAARERVTGDEILPRLEARGLSHAAVDKKTAGPATVYEHPQRPGRIGLINPLSCNFCSDCNRLRVTARGRLKLCLFSDDDHPLDLSGPTALALQVRRLIDKKPEKHELERGRTGNVATFRTIGG